MRRMVEKMMNCYGREITVVRGEESFSLRGFFQPVTGKVERLAISTAGPLGMENRERYVYIGPVHPAPEPGDQVRVDGKDYHVRSAQLIWGNGEKIYCWAMCTEKGGADEWGLNG